MESDGKSYVIGKTSWVGEARHLVRELKKAGFELYRLDDFNYVIHNEDRKKGGIISGNVVATCESRDLEDFLDNYHFELAA